MRLPVVPNISTKDGVSNKNARLTNCLKETSNRGEKAVVRPGLVLDAGSSGIGGGLVAFDNNIVSVYGTTLGFGITPGTSGGLSEVTTGLSSYVTITAARFIGGTSFLIGGISTDTEEGELYEFDTSVDVATPVTTDTISDVKSIATSGTTIVVASRSETFGGGATQLVKSPISPLNFVPAYILLSDPFCVKYADGRFVVIHASAKVSWSTDDGDTWNSYSLPVTHGRTLLYDGSAWWFYGGDGLAESPWAYSTTDFVTFSAQSLSGLAASDSPVTCAYLDGHYYLTAPNLWHSTDGKTWSSLVASPFRVSLASDGKVYAGEESPDSMYRIEGTSLTLITDTSFTGSYLDIDSNDSGSILIGCPNVASCIKIDVTEGVATIPALSTIATGLYDFAQSTT